MCVCVITVFFHHTHKDVQQEKKFYSYGHLPVISGYKWDYTFYKWGFVSTYNW